MDSNPTWPPRAAAIVALLYGVFLLLGGNGHLQAVLPMLREGAGDNFLFLPAAILMGAGLVHIVLAPWLWTGRRAACVAATVTAFAVGNYLIYLLVTGVPDHPLAVFSVLTWAWFAGVLWMAVSQYRAPATEAVA